MATLRITMAFFCFSASVFLLVFAAPLNSIQGQETQSENPFEQEPVQLPEDAEKNAPAPEGAGAEATGQPADDALLDAITKEMGGLIPADGDLDSAVVSKLREAAAAYADRNMDKALKLLNELKAVSPQCPPGEILIASLHFSAQRNALGFQALEAAAKKAPDYPGVYFAFGRMALNQNRLTDAGALAEKAGRAFQNGDFAEVETIHFRRQYFQIMTLVALRQERLEDASKLSASFQKVAPDDTGSLVLAAEVACNNGETEKSLEFLRRMRASDPSLKVPELIVAEWCRALGRVEESATLMRKAVSQHPDDAATQIAFADWAVGSEEFESAMDAVKKAESANQKETLATMWIKGQVAFAKEDYETAENELKKIFAQNQGVEITHQYALCLIENADNEKKYLAHKLAEKNLKASPNNKRALAAAGWILYRRGEKKNSEFYFAQATKDKNLTPETAYYLARFFAEKGDNTNAMLLLKQAVSKKGYFMYRQPATKLLKEVSAKLDKKEGQELPQPSNN